jgi:phosphocarrier protein
MPHAKAEVLITNQLGMHARPAGTFQQEANRFKSDITVCMEGAKADGKSILELMMLCATPGKTIEIAAEGPDADEAVQALVNLVKERFREER